MSLLSKTVLIIQSSCCTLSGVGWVLPCELYAVFVEGIALEAVEHLLV